MKSILALIMLLGSVTGGAQIVRPSRKAVTVFVDVNVIPMDSERILLHQTVIVRGDRITSVAPVATTRPPAGARIISGHGTQWLAPGLVDMHSHVAMREQLPLYLANGVTSFLNLGDHTSHDMVPLRKQIRLSGVTAPNMYAAFRLEGPGGNGVIVETPEKAREAVRYAKGRGYEFIKVYNQLAADVFAAICDEASKQHMGVVGHGVRSVGILGGFKLGQSMIAHAEEYLYTEFQKNGDSASVAATVQATRDAGGWVTPNLVAYGIIARQWGKPAVVDSLINLPIARYVSPRTVANWHQNGYDTRTGSLDSRYRFLQRFTLLLQQAGVPLLVGTDAPDIPGLVPGYSVHDDLAELVKAGLTPYQAFAAGTRNAGDFVRRWVPGDRFGVVAPGARADLVLLDANPLDDIANARRVAGVAVSGRWIARADLARMADSVRVMMIAEDRVGREFKAQLLSGAPLENLTVPRLEETLNGVAYDLLDGRKVSSALSVFQLIVKRFPASSNAAESLCEGYVAAADTVRAVKSCQAALRLDAWNADAQAVLRGLVKTGARTN